MNPKLFPVVIVLAFLGFTDTAVAQFVVQSTPAALTFNWVQGGPYPQPQTVNVTSLTSNQIDFTDSLGISGANYFTVNVSSGATPAMLTVSVVPSALAALAPGFHGGVGDTLFVYPSSGLPLNIQVTVNVTAAPPSCPAETASSRTSGKAVMTTEGAACLSVNPSSLSFAQAGTVAPSAQILSITSSSNSSVSFSVAISYASSGPTGWLAVSPDTGMTPGTVSVSFNAAGLAAGPYNAMLTVTQTNTDNSVTIPVSATVGTGAPTLTFTPTQLNFAWQVGTAAPPAETILVTSPAGTQVDFTVSASTSNCGNWLVVSPAEITTSPTPITVSIDTAGLPSTTTTCSGNIQASTPGASNPTTSIPVSLFVSVNPVLKVSPTSLEFGFVRQAAALQISLLFADSSDPATPLAYTYVVNPSSAGGPNFLSTLVTVPGQTSTPAYLAVGLNSNVAAGLTPNTYVDNLVISSTGAGSPSITVPVTLVVSNTATLLTNPSQLTMNYELGQQPPVAPTITVSSTGAPVIFDAAAVYLRTV